MSLDDGANRLLPDIPEVPKLRRVFADMEQIAQLGTWEWECPSGRVFWSEGIYRLYGLAHDQFEGTFSALLEHVHPADRPDVERCKDRVLIDREPFSVEHRIIRADGSTRLLLSRGEIFDSPSGEPDRIIGVSQDITERKELEERLQSQVQQLQELDRLKTLFVTTVSHEIRTPLTSIKGYAEFLEDGLGGPLSGQQGEFVRQIQEGAIRLERLVNDLVDFARLDAGTFKLKPACIDVPGQIRRVVESFRPQVDEARVRLEVAVPPEPVRLMADPQRIEQVVANLLSNAVKFTPEGGTIRVTVDVHDPEVRCEVQDTGVGISAEDLPKLFHRFSQLEQGVRKGGMGLGLSISKAIVEAHGGTIGVLSKPGAGSTFWFTLPCEPPSRVSEA